MFADLLPAFLKPIAKAIAVLITSWMVLLVAWLVRKTGVEIPIDPSVVETLVYSLLLSAVTYLTTNLPKEN